MDRLGTWVRAWARHVQRGGPPAQCGVVGHGEVEPEEVDDGADQPLGLVQGGQDGHAGVGRQPAPRRPGLGLPRRDRLRGEPHRQPPVPAPLAPPINGSLQQGQPGRRQRSAGQYERRPKAPPGQDGAPSCLIAAIQFSTWYALDSLPSLTVNVSIDIALKLRPVGFTPKNSSTGVPSASPLTVIRLPDVMTSLIVQCRSGITSPRYLNAIANLSLSKHSSLFEHD